MLVGSSVIVSKFLFAGFTGIDDPYEPPLKSEVSTLPRNEILDLLL